MRRRALLIEFSLGDSPINQEIPVHCILEQTKYMCLSLVVLVASDLRDLPVCLGFWMDDVSRFPSF